MKNKVKRYIQIAVVVILSLITVFPIYWITVVAFSPSSSFLSTDNSWLIPTNVTLEHFIYVFKNSDFLIYAVNSLVVASVTTIITLVISSFGGYSLGRLRYKGRDTIGKLILFTYIVPSVLLVIPLFTCIVNLNLQDNPIGLVLSYLTFSIPFCIWMLKGFFSSLPAALEEAAMLDGTSRMGAFIRIILPLAAPGIVAAAMFTFLLSWNEYLFALVFITKDTMRTLPVGIVASFTNINMDPESWANVMAASLMSSIPVFILFLLLQKHLISGMAAGAVKQ